MNTLHIETNHGFVELENFHIEHKPRTWGDCKGTYAVAVGTVKASVETSRLFHASSSREVYPKGTVVECAVYNMPYCTDKEKDTWFVSTVSF